MALQAFERAIALDPLWKQPDYKRDDLLQYLKNIQTSINNNGNMKPKQLHRLIRVLIIRKCNINSNVVNKLLIKLQLIIYDFGIIYTFIDLWLNIGIGC